MKEEQNKNEIAIFSSSNEYEINQVYSILGVPCIIVIIAIIFSMLQNY